MWMSEGQAKFITFCAILGIVVVVVGVPASVIYGIWWAVHHLRITP
jgi:hypothetical protein